MKKSLCAICAGGALVASVFCSLALADIPDPIEPCLNLTCGTGAIGYCQNSLEEPNRCGCQTVPNSNPPQKYCKILIAGDEEIGGGGD